MDPAFEIHRAISRKTNLPARVTDVLDIHTYSALPEDDAAPAPRANAKFRKLVHAYSGRARLPLLARDEERNLIGLVQDEGSQEALDCLVESYIGFITNIVGNFNRDQQFAQFQDDLLSVGSEGLIKAVHNFNLRERYSRLSTLARYYIAAEIHKFIRENIYPFRFGTNFHDKNAMNRIARIRTEFHQIHGRPMRDYGDDLELAAAFSGVPAYALARAISVSHAKIPVRPDTVELHDHRSELRAEPQVARKSGHAAVRRTIASVTSELSPRDRDIIQTVLSDFEASSGLIQEMSQKHDVTVERIRQIVRGGLADIRKALAENGLTSIDDVM